MKEVLNIPGLIKSVIEGMRDSANVLSFTDNSNDTYTVAVSDLKDLSNGDYVSFSDTTNFDKTAGYKISSIDENAKTFTISEVSGFATETGTYTANAPYFIYGHLFIIVLVSVHP